MKIKYLTFFSLMICMTVLVACRGYGHKTDAGDPEPAANLSTASKFMVDQSASTIKWEGKKPGTTHHGTIKLKSGIVKLLDDSISGSFLIDMTSISVEDLKGEQKQKLEDHLKGTEEGKENDFFNVTKFPTAAFEITKVTDKNGKKMIAGNLTLKEDKKNIEFPATYNSDGETFTLKSKPFVIDRTKWHVNYGSKTVFDKLKNNFINDDITLTLDIVAKKQM